MSNRPLISVIVPNYNHAPYLKERIDSILNQSFQNFELILLDDCSTDESVAILNSYKNHDKVSHLIVNEENSGSPFKQWKKGIELAQGSYIWIAESDDVNNTEFLSSCVEKLQNDSSQIVYTQSYDIDVNGEVLSHRLDYTNEFDINIWKKDFFLNGLSFIKDCLLVKNVVPNASAVVFKKPERDLIDWKIISAFKMCGDWMFWVLLCKKYSISFIKEPLNHFRLHDKSTRNHKNREIKKLRIKEEVVIRNFIFKDFGLFLKQRDIYLFSQWNSFFKFKELFSSDFKSGTLNRIGYLKYLVHNLQHRVAKILPK